MEVKKVTVTGGLSVFKPTIEGEGGEKKHLRRTRKQTVSYRVTGKLDEHGAPMEGGNTSNDNNKSIAPVVPPVSSVPLSVPNTGAEIKKIHINSTPVTPGPSEVIEPSSPNTKVLLGGKKPHRVKVLLTKKRHRDESSTPIPGKQTRVRKIHMGVRAIKKNVTRAKRISKTAKALPIETIRAELVKTGIIKESSKAPESVLRQMYADAKLVSSQSL